MYDVAIVGAGLFGQIIAKQLRADGHSVIMFDGGRVGSGSKPAACLMKPSWFSGLGKNVSEASLRILDNLYGLRELDFMIRPLNRRTAVYWVPPSLILTTEFVPDNVHKVETGVLTVGEDRRRVEARQIVVAAGVWSNELVDVPGLTGRAGAAFLWRDAELKEQFIKPWAPYRQIVAFNRGDGVWVGDGTAVKPENWDKPAEQRSRSRCIMALGQSQYSKPSTSPGLMLWGIRPYVPGGKEACYLSEALPRVWVATGGAKNGTVAAGWCAHVLSEKFS